MWKRALVGALLVVGPVSGDDLQAQVRYFLTVAH